MKKLCVKKKGLTFIKVPIMENIGGEMMDGSTFYFVAWIGWIIVTFFMKKDSIRWKLGACILIFIIFSPLHVTIVSFTVSVNALLLCIISFIGITLYSIWKKLYGLLSALIIAMLYTSFYLLEVYDQFGLWWTDCFC